MKFENITQVKKFFDELAKDDKTLNEKYGISSEHIDPNFYLQFLFMLL